MTHGVASAFGWWLYVCMNVCEGVGRGVWEMCMCNVSVPPIAPSPQAILAVRSHTVTVHAVSYTNQPGGEQQGELIDIDGCCQRAYNFLSLLQATHQECTTIYMCCSLSLNLVLF